MLVLSRRDKESITVTNEQTGEQIVFTLLRSIGGNSRIGIDAPDDYRIVRTELLEPDTLAEMPQGG